MYVLDEHIDERENGNIARIELMTTVILERH